ncbi:hypothetical protein SDC9_149340 [bioreactor metagenome]|uniref:Uncharacterized protein n=1 Tax=bioreactor metagenome TaxID=1076179 RepID=A0A645EK33_9ZZZZ
MNPVFRNFKISASSFSLSSSDCAFNLSDSLCVRFSWMFVFKIVQGLLIYHIALSFIEIEYFRAIPYEIKETYCIMVKYSYIS